jgi:tRNA threonylcarbamoyladenosine biosynthesis protein TsaB
METILTIDTSQTDTARVVLEYQGHPYEIVSTSKVLKSQMLLPVIESVLKEHTLTVEDITGIKVITGPGSFTGLRVGVTIANALGSLLGIPVNGEKALVNPTY